MSDAYWWEIGARGEASRHGYDDRPRPTEMSRDDACQACGQFNCLPSCKWHTPPGTLEDAAVMLQEIVDAERARKARAYAKRETVERWGGSS